MYQLLIRQRTVVGVLLSILKRLDCPRLQTTYNPSLVCDPRGPNADLQQPNTHPIFTQRR